MIRETNRWTMPHTVQFLTDHPRLTGALFLAALLLAEANAVAAGGGVICPDCAGP